MRDVDRNLQRVRELLATRSFVSQLDAHEYPAQITSNLFLSGIHAALQPHILHEFGISLIVNASSCENAFQFGVPMAIQRYSPPVQVAQEWRNLEFQPMYIRFAF